MKAFNILAVLFVMSAMLNAYQFFKRLELQTGGGVEAASPDGSMKAVLMDLKPTNPLLSNHDAYGQLTIRHEGKEWFTLRFSPTGLVSGAYRGGAKLTWSPDSRFIEARAPFVFVKVDAKRLRDRQLHPSPVLEPPFQDPTKQ